MFAIAFSIISITTGIFLNYGFGLSYWGPASIWTWPIVGVGNMMIALVVAELGTRIPLAGYAYQWSARLVNPTYGWFVGFAGLLYMAVGGGAIMLTVAAPLLLSEFNVNAPSPHLVLSVAIVLMLLPLGSGGAGTTNGLPAASVVDVLSPVAVPAGSGAGPPISFIPAETVRSIFGPEASHL